MMLSVDIGRYCTRPIITEGSSYGALQCSYAADHSREWKTGIPGTERYHGLWRVEACCWCVDDGEGPQKLAPAVVQLAQVELRSAIRHSLPCTCARAQYCAAT
jgi:hypothetical protein